MAKLGKIAEQTERFLRALAADIGVNVKAGDWLATDFKNGSVDYQAELPRDVSRASAQFFSSGLEVLADFDPENEGLNGRVSETAALEYARIGTLLDPDEIIRMGIISQGKNPRWRDITYGALSSIRREMEQPVSAHGSVQGIVHAWFKEAREPHFQLRELATDDLVKIYYQDSLYDRVAKAVQARSSTLIVAGAMVFDKVTRQATEMKAERIETMEMMTATEFDEVFGVAPNFEPSGSDEVEWPQ